METTETLTSTPIIEKEEFTFTDPQVQKIQQIKDIKKALRTNLWNAAELINQIVHVEHGDDPAAVHALGAELQESDYAIRTMSDTVTRFPAETRTWDVPFWVYKEVSKKKTAAEADQILDRFAEVCQAKDSLPKGLPFTKAVLSRVINEVTGNVPDGLFSRYQKRLQDLQRSLSRDVALLADDERRTLLLDVKAISRILK